MKNKKTKTIHKAFLDDLDALLIKYNATLTTEDHWQGYAECGEDVRMAVEFEDWSIPDLDLGKSVAKKGD